jgi:hypothetical protein
MKTLRVFPAKGLLAARLFAGVKSVEATGRAAVAATPRKKVRLVSFRMGLLLFPLTAVWRMTLGAP